MEENNMDFKILIVDDEHPIREWLVYLIRSNRPDYHVDSAANGQEALAKMRQSPYDLVVTDIRMPHMDGVELLKNISVNYPGTGTIVLSSYDDYSYVRSTFKYDAVDYLLKTEIDSESLLDSIDNFIQKKHAAKDNEQYEKKLQSMLLTGTGSNEEFLTLLSSYADFSLPGTCFCVLLKYDSQDEIQKPFYPSVNETTFQFSAALDKNVFLGCLSLASHPSLLTQLQLQSVYLRQLKKYNELSLLLYTDILTPAVSLFAEAENLCRYRDLDFYGITALKAPGTQKDQRSQLKEHYLAIRKTLYTLASQSTLAQIEQFLNLAKNILYPDIEDLKLMCSNIYETLYLNGYASDLTAYSRNMQKISSRISESKSWEDLKNALLCDLSLLYRRPAGSLVNLSPRISRAASIMEERYMDPISLVSIADELHVNPEYLSRSFKKEMGINFNAYLSNLRLQHALQLLKDPGIRISEIASDTGFQNPAYFSKCFKASFGISPQEWRSKNT